jgi:hypothetical protein
MKFKEAKFQVMEIAFVLFILVSFAITCVLAAYVYFQIQEQLHIGFGPESALNLTDAIVAYDKFEIAFGLFDKSIALIIVGLTLGLILTSFLIPAHPVFVIINIVGFILLVFLGAVYSNTYYAITATNDVIKNLTMQNFPLQFWAMQNLPWIAAGLVFISSIAMYVKGRLGEQ